MKIPPSIIIVFVLPLAFVGVAATAYAIFSMLSEAINYRISNGLFVPDVLTVVVFVIMIAICVVGYVIVSVFPKQKTDIEEKEKKE